MKTSRKLSPFILRAHLRRDFAAASTGIRQKKMIKSGMIFRYSKDIVARVIERKSFDLGSN